MKIDQLIIPCSGRGSRFHAITDTPKYLIPIAGRPMLDWAICSMDQGELYKRAVVIFHIDQCKNGAAWTSAVESAARFYLKRIAKHVIIEWQTSPLRGAADSILLVQQHIAGWESVIVFNCDQYLPEWNSDLREDADGWILGFHEPNMDRKWSYARVEEEYLPPRPGHLLITEVREKEPISEFATVGAYGFKRGRDLFWAIEEAILHDDRVNGEFYLAPTYNHLIKIGRKIVPVEVSGFEGLGTPEDVSAFCANHKLPDWRKK